MKRKIRVSRKAQPEAQASTSTSVGGEKSKAQRIGIRSLILAIRLLLHKNPVYAFAVGVGVLGFATILLLLLNGIYATFSPGWLRVFEVVKWTVTVAIFLVGLIALYETNRGEVGNRRAKMLGVMAVGLGVVLTLIDPPPAISQRDLEELEVFNREFYDSGLPPKLETLADAIEQAENANPFALAQAALARTNLQEAIRFFDQELVQLRPRQQHLAETYFYRAIALSRLQKDDEALQSAERSLAIDPEFFPAMNLKCRSLRALSRLEEALEACLASTKINTLNARGFSELGSVYVALGWSRHPDALGLYEKAVASFDISLGLDRTNPATWSNRASALIELGRNEEALHDAEEALRLLPGMPNALLAKGSALKRLGRLPEALEIYQEMARKFPNDAEALNNVGDALVEQGRDTEAVIYFKAAIAADQEFQYGYFNIGAALNRLGRHSEALESLRRAVELESQDADARVEMAIALEALGRIDEAMHQVNQALALDVDVEDGAETKERLITKERLAMPP